MPHLHKSWAFFVTVTSSLVKEEAGTEGESVLKLKITRCILMTDQLEFDCNEIWKQRAAAQWK